MMLIRASGRNGRIAEYRMLPPSGDHTGHVYAPANAEPSRSAFLRETSFLSVPSGFTVYIDPSIAAIAIRSTGPVATTRVGIGTGFRGESSTRGETVRSGSPGSVVIAVATAMNSGGPGVAVGVSSEFGAGASVGTSGAG